MYKDKSNNLSQKKVLREIGEKPAEEDESQMKPTKDFLLPTFILRGGHFGAEPGREHGHT